MNLAHCTSIIKSSRTDLLAPQNTRQRPAAKKIARNLARAGGTEAVRFNRIHELVSGTDEAAGWE
jgi:hypothetical protein